MLTRGLFNWNECTSNFTVANEVKEFPGVGYYEGQLIEYQNRGKYLDTQGDERLDPTPSGLMRHGLGVMVWLDGSIYQGEWQENEHHGRGRIIHPDGDIYDGEWC